MSPRAVILQDLCAELGYTMEEIADRISEDELALWEARHDIEPFGITGHYFRLARHHHALACSHTPKGKRPPSLEKFYTPAYEAPK